MELAPAFWLSILRAIGAGIVLLLLPGWLIQSLLLKHNPVAFLARIPLSFALSVGSISLLGISAFVLGGNLNAVEVGVGVWVSGLGLIWFWQIGRRYFESSSTWRFSTDIHWPSILVVMFAIICAALALYGGGWLSDRADGFYHLAAVHRQIDEGTPLPQGLYYNYESAPQSLNATAGTWHLVLSIFSLWSGVNIVWIWWYLPVLLAPLLVFAFYSFAYSLTKQPWLALLGTFLQFVLYDKLDFRVSVYPNQAGFILLWSAWILIILYLNSGAIRELLLIWGLAVAMAGWHLLIAEFFIVSLGMYFTLRLAAIWLFRQPWKSDVESGRLLKILLPILIAGGPLLLYRVLGGEVARSDITHWLSISPHKGFRSSVMLGYGFSIIGPLELYKVDPRWRFAPLRFALWLFTYLGALFLIPECLKRRRFALFLFGTVIVIPLIFFNPFLITFLRGKMSDIGIIRLVLLPPYGLILGWFFWDQIARWVKRWFSLPSMSGRLRGLLIIGLIAWAAGLSLVGYIIIRQGMDNLVDLYSPTSRHVYSLAETHAKMRRSDQPAYEFLSANSTRDAVVASDPESGYYLGGLTGRSVISVASGHFPPGNGRSHLMRQQDSLTIMDFTVELSPTLALLDDYEACLIWVDSRSPDINPFASRQKFENHPDLFEKLYEDPEVTIYHYLDSKIDCIP